MYAGTKIEEVVAIVSKWNPGNREPGACGHPSI
jgi:hypothetical protein